MVESSTVGPSPARMRTDRTVDGVGDVHTQAVRLHNGAAFVDPTTPADTQLVRLIERQAWVVYANAVAFAANKHLISIFNAAGSGKVVRLRKLFLVNLQTGAITGVIFRADLKRINDHSVGTQLTPEPMDDNNAALPAQVTVRTGATVSSEGAVLYPVMDLNDEETATQALTKGFLRQYLNVLAEGYEIQPHTLREGDGITLKCITSTTVGSFGYIMVFTVDTT